MEAGKKKFPIGIENFEEIRTKDFYYVDKTGLIRELLDNWGKVTLFTRPRRFGKSLNLSMMKSFFAPNGRKEIFEGLAISKEIHQELKWGCRGSGERVHGLSAKNH